MPIMQRHRHDHHDGASALWVSFRMGFFYVSMSAGYLPVLTLNVRPAVLTMYTPADGTATVLPVPR